MSEACDCWTWAWLWCSLAVSTAIWATALSRVLSGGEVFLVGVVHGLLGEDALLLHLECAVVGVLEHGEVGGFGGDLIEGDGGGGGAGAGFGCGELGLLRGDLVEDLFLIELGEDLALADGVVDVGVELGDDAAGLGFDLDFGDGLDLAGGDDRARDIAGFDGAKLGGINGRCSAEGLGGEEATTGHYADNHREDDPKALARFRFRFQGVSEAFKICSSEGLRRGGPGGSIQPIIAVLPDGPATRGAGVRTPFYCFAWASRWSARILFATNGSAQPKASARNEVAAPRVVGSSGRTSVIIGGVLRIQAYLRSMPRTLPWMLTLLAGA